MGRFEVAIGDLKRPDEFAVTNCDLKIRVLTFKVTICDLKDWPRRPPLRPLRLYGTGRGDAFERAAESAGDRREHRDHAGVRAFAATLEPAQGSRRAAGEAGAPDAGSRRRRRPAIPARLFPAGAA